MLPSVWSELQLKLNVICRGFPYPVQANNETVCLCNIRLPLSNVVYQFHASEVVQLISSSWDIALRHWLLKRRPLCYLEALGNNQPGTERRISENRTSQYLLNHHSWEYYLTMMCSRPVWRAILPPRENPGLLLAHCTRHRALTWTTRTVNGKPLGKY